ncbi:MAG TPA: class IV adenylate cyclase [Thermoanaerobaculia bacterium]|nr:class IV adenylate cyclase [Thermoanaerobaculia bacterium]
MSGTGVRKGAEKPPIERELKFAQVDLEALRQRLLEVEAERLGPAVFEENWLLDRGGELAERMSILRVRAEEGRGAVVTFKGPATFDGPAKVRTELEMRVENAELALALLQALGYAVERRYQKMREEWRLGTETICLDHTPIGDFVEFEGDRADAVAKRCGFDLGKALRKSYLMLYAEHLAAHPTAPFDMVFTDDRR